MYDVCVYVYSMCPSSAHFATDGSILQRAFRALYDGFNALNIAEVISSSDGSH